MENTPSPTFPAKKSEHSHSSCHYSEIMSSELCGCFFCRKTFKPKKIQEWIDEPARKDGTIPEKTAVCPKCGIDSVIGSASGIPLTPEKLSEMREKYFGL